MMVNNFKQTLIEFKDAVDKFNRYTLLERRVEERLDKSLRTYLQQLEEQELYLQDKDPKFQAKGIKL